MKLSYFLWILLVLGNFMLTIDNLYKYTFLDITITIQILIVCTAIFWVILTMYFISPGFYKLLIRRLKEKWQ